MRGVRGSTPKVASLERRLAVSLAADRQHPSRIETVADDGSTVVRPSGTSYGLAIAISILTDETEEEVMNRVGQP